MQINRNIFIDSQAQNIIAYLLIINFAGLLERKRFSWHQAHNFKWTR